MTHKHFANFQSELVQASEDLICDQCSKPIPTGVNCAKVHIKTCGGEAERDWCFGCWKELTTAFSALRGAIIHAAH